MNHWIVSALVVESALLLAAAVYGVVLVRRARRRRAIVRAQRADLIAHLERIGARGAVDRVPAGE